MKELSLASNAAYMEEQYERWKANPMSVTEDWRWFFSGL
ncbi:MAG: 2-oxoglutarate dehydrogenase E1 subunit family protein [Desulfosoma sp.]